MKFNFAKIKKLAKIQIISEFPIILAKHFILTSLAFLLVVVLFSFLIFYKYVILPEKIEPEVKIQKSIFKEELYKKVLGTWEEQARLFEETDNKEYINPFKMREPTEEKIQKP